MAPRLFCLLGLLGLPLFTACSDDGFDSIASVDAGAAGEVALDVDAAVDLAAPAGERCGDAARITIAGDLGSTSVFSTTEPLADDYDLAACGVHAVTPGPDRVFVVNVAAGHRLVATVKGVSSTLDPALYLIKGPAAACDAEQHTCLATADVGPAGDYERVVYGNTSATALDVYVVVDGATPSGGAFRLDVWIDALPPTPVGDTVALAEPVELRGGRAILRGTTSLFPGYNDDYAPRCTAYEERGNDHVYAVTVPAGARLDATLAPKFSAALYVLGGSTLACLGGDSGIPGAPAVVSYENTTAAPVDVLVVVDSYRELTGGTYELSFALAE